MSKVSFFSQNAAALLEISFEDESVVISNYNGAGLQFIYSDNISYIGQIKSWTYFS